MTSIGFIYWQDGEWWLGKPAGEIVRDLVWEAPLTPLL